MKPEEANPLPEVVHERLEPLYAQAPERLRYREFPLSGYMMRPEDWHEAIQDAEEWLIRFLGVE